MRNFIVTVQLHALDIFGIESSFIATTYVPVIAKNKTDATKCAVVWQSDSGNASQNDKLLWQCSEPSRKLLWTAAKCLPITEEEMDMFLSTTQGLYKPFICKQVVEIHEKEPLA